MRIYLVIFLLLPLFGQGAIVDQAAPSSGTAGSCQDLQGVCKELLSAGMAGDITKLRPSYEAVTNAEIREAITATTALYWLSHNNVAEADRFALSLTNLYPNSKYQFLLTHDANLLSCSNCQGSGSALVMCPDCSGDKKCRACGGKGKVAAIASGGSGLVDTNSTLSRHVAPTAHTLAPVTHAGPGGLTTIGDSANLTAPCPMCGGSGKCKLCAGTGKIKGKCPVCSGSGSVLSPKTRLAYYDVLLNLNNLAAAAAKRESGKAFLGGQWIECAEYDRIMRRRADDRAYFIRVTDEAEHAKTYDTAIKLIDNAIARRPDSIYSGDVQRVKALIRADATDSNPKELLGPENMASAAKNARKGIPYTIGKWLEASQGGTNLLSCVATNSLPKMPGTVLGWNVGEPELLGRSARVPVRLDFPSKTGFALPETWTFLLVFENEEWKLWQTLAP